MVRRAAERGGGESAYDGGDAAACAEGQRLRGARCGAVADIRRRVMMMRERVAEGGWKVLCTTGCAWPLELQLHEGVHRPEQEVENLLLSFAKDTDSWKYRLLNKNARFDGGKADLQLG